jgi:hypothetical protein
MTVRTTSKTVTFMHPFRLNGMLEAHPAGTYIVETDEELLRAPSVQAYRRIATMIRLSTRSTGTVLTQIVETNPEELAGALARDAQPEERVPQRAYSKTIVPRKKAVAGWNPFAKAGNIGLPSTLRHRFLRSCQDDAMQNSCVVTAGRDQHEAVPYCVVEGQRPPEVKTDPKGIEHTPNSDQNRRHSVHRGEHGPYPYQD